MLTLNTPSFTDFNSIKKYIAEFELDDRALQINEFTAAYINNDLVGFGRLRQYENCCEICTLGVLPDCRRKGIGVAITKNLIEKATSDCYLVCIIPEYFKPMGFEETEMFPAELQNKLTYCTQSLVVPETYVVMAYRNSFKK
jgi:N-acetylglutamate synthase-like GNAT family acetyltransferase